MIKKPHFHSNPEAVLQGRIVTFLELMGWHVEVMHGNAFQKGIPDLYMYHKVFGHKWADVKLPSGSVLTKAQCQKWPKWEAAGIDIWILKADNVTEYEKLFGPANWREMWKPRYDKYVREINDILDELEDEDDDDDE